MGLSLHGYRGTGHKPISDHTEAMENRRLWSGTSDALHPPCQNEDDEGPDSTV